MYKNVILTFLLLNLFPSTSLAKDWSILLSGGRDKDSNHYHYIKAIIDMHTALLARDFPRENIYVLMSDGDDPGVDGNYKRGSKFYSSPVSIQNDDYKDVNGPATIDAIDRTFNELAKKVKTGGGGGGGGGGMTASY